MTTWRVEANTAYSTEAPRIVYRPYCGGTPTTSAYPSACGMTSAHTERPARRSGVSHDFL